MLCLAASQTHQALKVLLQCFQGRILTISAVCILCVRKASQHVQENDCMPLRLCASYALFIGITFIVTFPCHPLFSERKIRDNIWLCLSFALHLILNT